MTRDAIHAIAACEDFDCKHCEKRNAYAHAGVGYTPRHRENLVAREYVKLEKELRPAGPFLIIATALHAMEAFAESECLGLSREERDHVAGALAVLRERYDEYRDRAVSETSHE
jgi:hypothetical protein